MFYSYLFNTGVLYFIDVHLRVLYLLFLILKLQPRVEIFLSAHARCVPLAVRAWISRAHLAEKLLDIGYRGQRGGCEDADGY